jgi:uncharacterized protein
MLDRDGRLDLGSMRLTSGEGRRVQFEVAAPAPVLGGNDYVCVPDPMPVRLGISRTMGSGWAFHLSFSTTIQGPCTRCLDAASVEVEVESREATRPGGGEDLECPYLEEELLDVTSWARDSLVLALPSAILCRADCRGLCEECGKRLDELPEDHAHEKLPDPRWEALRNLES